MGFQYSDYVSYSRLDPVKRLALELFAETMAYPERLGIKVVQETLGEPAVGFDFSGICDGDWLLTANVEGLGTKNMIADAIYNMFSKKKEIAGLIGGARVYRNLGQDVVAMSLNDQLAIGADVFAYHDIITCGNSKWFTDDLERTRELLLGYRLAADMGKFAIPQGETPELPDIVAADTLELVGASIGLIRPKDRLVTGAKIREGDAIFGLESSGPHSNGLTKIRRIAQRLPEGYVTPLGDGRSLGEAILEPTILYSRPIIQMFDAGIDIHYLQPITGHGWAKICRARFPFTYVIEDVPKPPLVFQTLIDRGRELGFDSSHRENYSTWNMGIGFVIIAPKDSERTIKHVASKFSIEVYVLGHVAPGDRQVLMPFSDEHGRVVYTPSG